MKIVLMGAPGAGKGTQADFICQRFNIPKISSGDMLRAEIKAKSEIGKQIESMMGKGEFVPLEIVIQLVIKRLKSPECQNGFLLDGFPRTINQAEVLEKEQIFIDVVLELFVSDDEIVRRISGRRIHLSSGRVYHIEFNPPKVANRDDITLETLIQRVDDTEEIIRNRLKLYHEHTEPLIHWYQSHGYRFIKISGEGKVQDVEQRIMVELSHNRTTVG